MGLLARRARLSETLRRPLVISGVLFGLVLALRAWLQWAGPLPGDRYALYHYYPGSHTLPAWAIDGYVEIAKPWVVLVTLIVGVWALRRRIGLRAAVGFLLAAVVIVWNAVFKAAFGATPLFVQAHDSGVNYPSGHTSYATAIFGYLAWIGVRRRQPGLVAVCLLVTIGMGPERVLSGAHLPSDVVGGYLLGLAWLILITAWVEGEPSAAAGSLAVP